VVRIIAGEFRGRQFLAPDTATTRPITDRVKQSVFDILSPVIPGAIVYDCFAGTGSMGLECLSRGAAHVSFFEADRSAGGRLRKNIATLNVADRSTVIAGDLFKWFGDQRTNGSAGLIFLDPPYRFLNDRPNDLRRLANDLADRHAAPEALVIFRHDERDELELPRFTRADIRNYGGMTVQFLRLNS
jgi:16S rRNA (guanine966-N2)-methyltransferase